MASEPAPTPDFRLLVAQRLGALSLDGDDEAGIIEELAFEIEERYHETVRDDEKGDPKTVARFLAEVDWAALRRDIPRALRPWSSWVLERTPAIARTRFGRFLLEVGSDLRGILRTYRRPGAARLWIAAFGLALGIGVGTAVMSLGFGTLSRALPLPEPERLLWLWEQGTDDPDGPPKPVTAEEFLRLRAERGPFAGIAAYRFLTAAQTHPQPAESFDVALVSDNFFSVLRATARLGRTIGPADVTRRGPRAVVLSDTTWRQRFGASPQILGSQLEWNHEPVVVVGVMPSKFGYPTWAEGWLSARFPAPEPLANSIAKPDTDRGSHYHYLRLIGRLARGATLESARERLTRMSHDSEAHSINLLPLRQDLYLRMQPTLAPLVQSVSLVLLVAGVGVGNLLLASALARRRELSVRAALGASGSRIARLLATECLALSTIACFGGLAIGYGGMYGVLAFGAAFFPAPMSAALDPTAVAFAVGASLASGLAFGLGVAWSVSGERTAKVLRGERGVWSRRTREGGRSLMVIGAVAACTVVVLGAVLLMRGFFGLVRTDPGFSVAHLLTFAVYPSGAPYAAPEATAELAERLDHKLSSLVGVDAVGVASEIPLDPDASAVPTKFSAAPPLRVEQQSVSPGFFSALDIQVLEGRAFRRGDDEASEPVAIVNQRLASRLSPRGSVLGIGLQFEGDKEPWRKIVGVVADAHLTSLAVEPPPEIYLPFAQRPQSEVIVVLRTEGKPASWIGLAKDAIAEIAPDVPTKAMRTGDDLVSGSVARERFLLGSLLLLAAASLALTAVALVAVMASWVAERNREIAIRLSVGASRNDVFRWILGRGLRLVALGVVLGLCGSLLRGDPLLDLTAVVVTTLAMAGLAISACVLPARNAMRVEPVTVLKS